MNHLWPEPTEALYRHLPLGPSYDEHHSLVQALAYVGQVLKPDEVVAGLAKYEVEDHELAGLEMWFFSKRFMVRCEWSDVEKGRPSLSVVPWSELHGVVPTLAHPLSKEAQLSSVTLTIGDVVLNTREWDLAGRQDGFAVQPALRNRALLDMALEVLSERR